MLLLLSYTIYDKFSHVFNRKKLIINITLLTQISNFVLLDFRVFVFRVVNVIPVSYTHLVSAEDGDTPYYVTL